MTTVVYSSSYPVSPETLFEFHMDAANLTAISPPFPPVRVEAPPGRPQPGDRQVMVIGWGRVAFRWVARIERVVEGSLLQDAQESGPFRRWQHRHRVTAEPGGARLTDSVSFRLLPSPVGEFLEFWTVRPMLWGMFAFRHRRTRKLVVHHN
jgi:ligand-binding SRPBCC domain-containing protein